MPQKKLAIFDLDGTLLDTIADLAQSTNHALQACNFPTHPTEDYRLFVGNGINKLFERALPEGEKTTENILLVRSHFIPHYDCHDTDLSTPYPGITDMLGHLQQAGVLLAVASNKYQSATSRLVSHFFPEMKFCRILGQREGVAIKPDPQIVHEIMDAAGVQPEEVIYVGDSGVDMQTALNARVTAIGVTWGFRPRQELEQFCPTYLVDTPEEIESIIIGKKRVS